MPQFKYDAKDAKGVLISGVMDAENRAMVIARLQSMNYFPVKISAESDAASGRGWGGFLGRRIRSADVCDFYRQMADLITAGIALVKGLQIVSTQITSPAMRRVVAAIAADVQGGETFGHALDHHPKVFPKLAVALINSGERGGFLPDVLQQLASFSEMEEELRGKVRAALAYPIVMVFVGTAVVIFLMSFVMPKITGIYAEMRQDLPFVTDLLIKMTGLFSRRWYVLVGAVVLGVVFAWRFARSRQGRRFIHAAALKLPVLGDVILKREISRFARTFGQMLKNGVPILQALEIVRDVATNELVREAIEQAPPDIAQGAGVSGTLKKRDLFPPGVINMIAIGEETGRLPEVLLQIAPSYEAQADRMVKTLTSLIEPIIILLMGVVVGFIVIAMLLPILTISPTGK